MTRFVVDGSTTVLTGAASGIGRSLAHELSRRGGNLVLLDRDAEGLGRVAADIRASRPGRTVLTHVVDLGDAVAALATAEAVRDVTPRIDLLVNNAGVALGGRFDQISLEDFSWVLDINFRAVVVMAHTLLPCLVATPGSHIANVSSLFGLVAPGGQTAYASSKFAVRGFGDALRQELALLDVGVTTVHPGGIRTHIAESARLGAGVTAEEHEIGRVAFAKLLRIEPDVAARHIVDGVVRRRPRVLIGASTYALDIAARIAPGSYGRLLALGDRQMRDRAAR